MLLCHLFAFQASEIHPHPNYTLSHYHFSLPKFDIALVRLARPARLSRSVRLACLPSRIDEPPAGSLCSVSGWGHLVHQQGPSPSLLHHAEVPLVNFRYYK